MMKGWKKPGWIFNQPYCVGGDVVHAADWRKRRELLRYAAHFPRDGGGKSLYCRMANRRLVGELRGLKSNAAFT